MLLFFSPRPLQEPKRQAFPRLGSLRISPDCAVTQRHSRCFLFFSFWKPHARFSHAFPSSCTCSEGCRKRMTVLFPLRRQCAAVKARLVRASPGETPPSSSVGRWRGWKETPQAERIPSFLFWAGVMRRHCVWNYIRKRWQGDKREEGSPTEKQSLQEEWWLLLLSV